MKRLLVLGVFVLLCVVLVCGCDTQPTDEPAVDINVPTHTLDEFKNGDFSCHVTVETAEEKIATGVKDEKKPEPVTYEFSGQETVDIYNLLDRANWVKPGEGAQSTGTFTQMLTLDFYAGRSVENAKAYYGSFVLSNQERTMASASPSDLSMTMAMAPPGTYEAVYDYIIEHGEVNS